MLYFIHFSYGCFVYFQAFQYDLELIPDLKTNFTTSGKVKIHMQGKGSDKIRLHAKQLIIDEDSVTVKTIELIPANIQVVGHEYDIDREFYVIHLEEALKDGYNYTLYIEFTSILNDDLSGKKKLHSVSKVHFLCKKYEFLNSLKNGQFLFMCQN